MSDLITQDEITRLLLDARGVVTFHTAGYCMFPCMRPRDRITVDARRIEEIAVGEVAVFRRGRRIVAHRVVEVGETDGLPYLVTRPDRAWRNEAPLHAADVLGVVTRVQRRNRDVNLAASPLSPLARRLIDMHVAFSGCAASCARKTISVLGFFQESPLYHAVAGRLAKRYPLEMTLRVPLLPAVNDLYRCFTLHDIPDAILREAASWSIVLTCNGAPAAALTIERDAERQEAWWVRQVVTRIRYRGLGFEDQLLTAGEACLSRLGAAQLCLARPADAALRRLARSRGFTDIPGNSSALEKTVPIEGRHA